MNKRISGIYKIFGALIILLMIGQGAVQAPVACFEPDGHVNVELGCEFDLCEININDENSLFDECKECVDIPLWPYTPEFRQAFKAGDKTFNLKIFDFVTRRPADIEQIVNFTTLPSDIFTIKFHQKLSILSTRLLL